MAIVNTHYPGYASQVHGTAQVCVVLTQDDNLPNHYAAYIGLVGYCASDAARAKAAEWVATRGSKLRYTARPFVTFQA